MNSFSTQHQLLLIFLPNVPQKGPPKKIFGGSPVCFCRLLAQAAIEESDDLAARAVARGVESRRARTGGHAVFHGPQDGICVVGVRLDIGERILCLALRAVLHAVQERHDLAARAGRVGREQRVAHAGGDLVLDGPQNGLIVVAVRLHVGEGHLACGRLGATGGAPQERDGLRAGAGVVGAKVVSVLPEVTFLSTAQFTAST